MPSFSVVIPTLNAAKEIGTLLDLLLCQTLKPSEVMVVDSSSDDDTQRIVASYPNVKLKVIQRRDFDHGGTRHDAFLDTSGDYVCFLTQDAIPYDREYFLRLLAPFENPDIAMVSGRQLPKPEARPFERLVRRYNYPNDSFVRSKDDIARLGIKAFFASDVCSAYRRSAYLEVGGFDYPLNTNEDMLMAAKLLDAGYKIAYAADARVLHSHNLTPKQQFERNRQIGVFLESHSSVFSGISEVGEGKKLALIVSKELIAQKQFFELFAFGVDCAARLLGNRAGRRSVRNGLIAKLGKR